MPAYLESIWTAKKEIDPTVTVPADRGVALSDFTDEEIVRGMAAHGWCRERTMYWLEEHQLPPEEFALRCLESGCTEAQMAENMAWHYGWDAKRCRLWQVERVEGWIAPQFPSASATDLGSYTENQDRGLVDSANHQLVIADGHGIHGSLAAETVTAVAAANPTMPFDELFALMEATFHARLRHLLVDKQTPFQIEDGAFYNGSMMRGLPIRGGTTATVVRFQPDGSIQVAAAGDSDVLVFDSPTDPGTCMTPDHTCMNPAEWQRVHASHPTTKFRFDGTPYGRAERQVWTKGSNGVSGPVMDSRGGFAHSDVRGAWGAYVTPIDNLENLAMTRSIGDFHMKRNGVIYTPDVQTLPPPIGLRAIIAGSDGLWDTLQFAEARDLVFREDLLGQPEAATAALLAFGLERARTLFGPTSCDNITCIVAYQAPVQAPVQTPVQAPVQTPVQSPVQVPVQVPVQTPVKECYCLYLEAGWSGKCHPCNGL